jgi:ABC-type nickel/cobalt efflux system permease component RcnA
MNSTRCMARLCAALAIAFAMPTVAYAHPMGNFSINHYAKIQVGARRIDLEYIIDMAEIPTFQETQVNGLKTDTNASGVNTYLVWQAEVLKKGLRLELSGRSLHLNNVSRQVIFPAGAGGLPTMKMGFHYRASLTPAASQPYALRYNDTNFPNRAGWKEVIAVSSPGVTLSNSSVPSEDRSAALSNYPTDLLHSPPQTLSANLTFRISTDDISNGESADSYTTGAMKLTANQQKTPRSAFTELVTSNRTDLAFVLMAAAIAAMLGGFHAFEPGHGKTLVAAYLVGSHGTARHAVLLASVVTASHTISVYLLGIITLFASNWVVPERLYPWLSAASGLLVAALGFTLFMRRFIASDSISAGRRSQSHSHGAGQLAHRHTWWGGHVHDGAPPGHQHTYKHLEHTSSHDHTPISAGEAKIVSLKSLFVLGITGGIVPCPAALVVLLGALAIHRIAFGMFLIVAFSVGLAAVLVSFGLAMVYARRFFSRFESRGPLTERWLPLASSAVITLIGVTIALQSLVTAGVFRVGA